jgi:thiol-disulfide isomerase/thioredoxin
MKPLILSLLILFSLAASAQDSTSANSINDSIQLNRVILDTNIDKAILYGYCTEQGLKESPVFSNYWKKEYPAYTPKLDFLETLNDSLQTVKIVVVFGSWCPDSQREVPRLMRILDELNYPLDSLTIIAVNRMKTVDDIDIKHYMIEFVPTIIFYKNDFEIGRIVEMPMQSLEDDMASILMKTF